MCRLLNTGSNVLVSSWLSPTRTTTPALAARIGEFIYLASLGSPERKLLLRARSNVEYADGYLLYVRDRILVAHPFDPDRLALVGDPVPVAEGLQYSAGTFIGVFSASRNGVLVYRLGEAEEERPLR